LTLASLSRREFRGRGNEAVDYSHRVSAEYIAAAWLAERIQGGLPLSRVEALIGFDGVPAPELRGVHAWLSLFLPELANSIIDADPLGVLVYGDASSLDLSARSHLLKALTSVAAADPFFSPNDPVPDAMSAICRKDMIPEVSALLRQGDAPFGIR